MNGKDNFGTNQAVSWYQASKDIKEFCQSITNSFLNEYGDSPIVYYDQKQGMPECEYVSASITDEIFFGRILDYFITKLTPNDVIQCGQYEFVCFYPDLAQILGDKEYIVHNDDFDTWCIHVKNPYVFSRDFFELLADQIVEQINKISMFDVKIKKINGIPCLVTHSIIDRICSAKQFDEWIYSYNNLVYEDLENNTHSDYVLLAETGIEGFDLTAHWEGNDDDLTKLPLYVNIRQIEYERKGDLDCPYCIERKMQVTIDDNSIIHIKCTNKEICKTYFNLVNSAMREIKYSKRIAGVLYHAVYDDLEYYVKYIIDNKYEQDGSRFVSILHHYDTQTWEVLSSDDYYKLQACILVGVENV